MTITKLGADGVYHCCSRPGLGLLRTQQGRRRGYPVMAVRHGNIGLTRLKEGLSR